MKKIGILEAKDKSIKIDILKENNEEFVQIGMNTIPIKFINLREFERWDIIEK